MIGRIRETRLGEFRKSLSHPIEINVWTARLQASATVLARYEKWLSPDEIQKANAFRFSHLRTSFVVARGTLRRLVGQYSGLPPQQIKFVYTEQGKPFLPESKLSFNLSHSGEYLACVFSAGVAVGIDIEQIRQMDDMLDIARRFFAAPEVRAIEDAPLETRSNLFFQIWTLKESFIKATGEGLGRPLDQFAVLNGAEPSIELIGRTESAGNWKLQSFCPASGYLGAVAMESNAVEMHWNVFEHEATSEGE